MKTFLKYFSMLVLGFGLYPLLHEVYVIEWHRTYIECINLENQGKIPKMENLSSRFEYVDQHHRFKFLGFTDQSSDWSHICWNDRDKFNLVCAYIGNYRWTHKE